MDRVLDIIEKYRHNELQPNLQPLIDSLSILTQTITTMQQDINTLKESPHLLSHQIENISLVAIILLILFIYTSKNNVH